MFLKRDTLFESEKIKNFEFSAELGTHFQDMLYRSIPDYSNLQLMIQEITAYYIQDHSSVIDLGCSQGNTMLNLRNMKSLPAAIELIGIDNCQFFCELAHTRLSKQNSDIQFKVLCQSLEESFPNFLKSSVIIACLTLHFLDPKNRKKCLEHCYKVLNDKGCLILIEKTAPTTKASKKLYKTIHESYRKKNHYSPQAILNKKKALKGKLQVQTKEYIVDELKACGYKEIESFWKWGEFMGWIVTK